MGLDITDPGAWKSGSHLGKKPRKKSTRKKSTKRKGTKRKPSRPAGGESSAYTTVHRHGGDFFSGVGGKKGANIAKRRLF